MVASSIDAVAGGVRNLPVAVLLFWRQIPGPTIPFFAAVATGGVSNLASSALIRGRRL
jgi:hypothetical protein